MAACKCSVYEADGFNQIYHNMRMFWSDPFPEMTTIPAELFVKFPQLRHLRLTGGIQTISRENFHNGTEKLFSLELTESKIKVIPTGTFASAQQLRNIGLSRNAIENIENGAFENLAVLKFLDLSNNSIRMVRSSTFSYIASLEILNLDNNKIAIIEEDSFKMANLLELVLSHNEIHTIAPNVFANAPRLAYLELIAASLIDTGNAFKGLKELKTLYLSDNNAAGFDLKDFMELPNLESLFLQNTSLKVSFELTNRTSNSKLRILDLSYNKIDDALIFEKLAAFDQLQQVNLEHNEVKTIANVDFVANNFKNLSFIYLFGNENVNSDMPKTAGKLQVILESELQPLPLLRHKVKAENIEKFVQFASSYSCQNGVVSSN